jgi:LPS O-antigen subunit length determinant protein (WzzB/FepE family)
MKKKSLLNNYDEIDLIELFKIIWNDKIKILLITTILFLLGLGYFYYTPNVYLFSLKIIKYDNPSLHNHYYLNELLKNKNYQIKITDQILFDNFNNELNNYKENISNLLLDINKKKFLENKGSFKVTKNKSDLILNFEGDNIDVAKDIFQKIINTALTNSKKSMYRDLDLIIKKEKKRLQTKNLIKLEYLKKQRSLAEELNIVNIPYGYTGSPFYLRGYVAIDKEIELIEKYEDIEIKNLKQEIELLKKTNIKWIKYDINSITKKSLKNTILILITSILLGLISGILFVLISKIPQFLRVSKN